jgi:hypothetical protein
MLGASLLLGPRRPRPLITRWISIWRFSRYPRAPGPISGLGGLVRILRQALLARVGAHSPGVSIRTGGDEAAGNLLELAPSGTFTVVTNWVPGSGGPNSRISSLLVITGPLVSLIVL